MRLVTRPDFDGLVCGALITLVEDVDSYLYAEPKFFQDGMVNIREGDIITNLPYHPNCSLWFDHHITNNAPGFGESSIVPGRGAFRLAPSAARVVYEYYNFVASHESRVPSLETPYPKPATPNSKLQEGLKIFKSERIRLLLEDTDKIDAGRLTREDVLHPEGYVLISMAIDGKRTNDEPYWLSIIRLLRDAPLEEVLRDKEIQRRCQQVLGQQEELRAILLNHTTLEENVILVDLRGIRDITDVNRFLVFTLFPTGNISLKIADDMQRADVTSISVGYNIFNTTSNVNVGALMQKFSGGGHKVVGSCRVSNDQAEQAIKEILKVVKEKNR